MGDIPPLPPPPTPAAEPYGPATPAVRRFLQRLAAQPEVVWLAAARSFRDPAQAERRRRADRGLAATLRRTGREPARDAVVGPVVQMARRVALALHREPEGEGFEELAEPALAAALALVVHDELGAELLKALYEPWAGAIPLEPLLEPPSPAPG